MVVAEVRFESPLPSDAVFGAIYPGFQADYPQLSRLPVTEIPAVIRDKDAQFEFQPYYQLQAPNYVIQIGPKVFSILRQGEYPGWEDFGSTVKAVIARFFRMDVAKTVLRASIRYTNFFSFDIYGKLNARFLVADQPFNSSETMVRTVLDMGGFQQILIITNTAVYNQFQNGVMKPSAGSVIDIDTLLVTPTKDLAREYPVLVDKMHGAEKTLFFALLKTDFVATLRPEY